MKVLKGILKESREYYQELERKINNRLSELPKGSIKKRIINNKVYYYIQKRYGKKVIHKYIGVDKPEWLIKEIEERKALIAELKKVKEALKILEKAKGSKHD